MLIRSSMNINDIKIQAQLEKEINSCIVLKLYIFIQWLTNEYKIYKVCLYLTNEFNIIIYFDKEDWLFISIM